MNDAVDSKYYEVVGKGSLSERVLLAARSRMYDDFLRYTSASATDSILDVGVSDIINEGANFLERLYPHRSMITACGLSDAGAFRETFPECRYVRIKPNLRLPFDDGQFEIATSNAVLEHVGSEAHQRLHIAELCRVAHRVYVTVPHRYFPIEHHTSIPLLHFSDKTFALASRLLGNGDWAREENLILMTMSRLRRITSSLRRPSVIGYTGLKLGPFSSNIFVSIREGFPEPSRLPLYAVRPSS